MRGRGGREGEGEREGGEGGGKWVVVILLEC